MTFSRKIETLVTAINNKILNFISIRANNKIFYFNINDIKFGNYAIREIKIDIIKYYLNNLNLKNSFKIHLFNNLYRNNRDIYKKACLIKFLSVNDIIIEKITARFLSKEDITLFKF